MIRITSGDSRATNGKTSMAPKQDKNGSEELNKKKYIYTVYPWTLYFPSFSMAFRVMPRDGIMEVG